MLGRKFEGLEGLSGAVGEVVYSLMSCMGK